VPIHPRLQGGAFSAPAGNKSLETEQDFTHFFDIKLVAPDKSFLYQVIHPYTMEFFCKGVVDNNGDDD
jgi:hypothetical protein